METEILNNKIINRSKKGEFDLTEEDIKNIKEYLKNSEFDIENATEEDLIIFYMKQEIADRTNSSDFCYNEYDGIITIYELSKAIKEIYDKYN